MEQAESRVMNRWPIRFAVGVAAIVAAAAEGAPQPDAVSAQGWFLGVGIGAMDYTEPSYSTNALDYLCLQGGWRFNRYLAIDARAGAAGPWRIQRLRVRPGTGASRR